MRTVITLLVLFSFSQAFTFRYTKRSAVVSRFNGDIATIKNAERGSKFSTFLPKLYASNVENDDADETKEDEDKEEEDEDIQPAVTSTPDMAADTGAKSTTLSDKQLARDLDQVRNEGAVAASYITRSRPTLWQLTPN